MLFRTLLKEHDRWRGPDVLSSNLGDGFLMNHNPVFNRVRRAAARIGCRFVSDLAPAVERYVAYPLMGLSTILRDRTVPYVDNVSILRDIVRTTPEVDIPALYLAETLWSNHALHESAHVIAFSLLRPRFPPTRTGFTFAILLSEAFANTVESMAQAHVGDPFHALFLALNSFRRPNVPAIEDFRAFASSCDEIRAMEFLTLVYLFVNLGRKSLGRDMLTRAVARLMGEQTHPPCRVPDIITRAFRLGGSGGRFVTETTSAYFGAIGHAGELRSVRQWRSGKVERLAVPAIAELYAAVYQGANLPARESNNPQQEFAR